MRVFLATVLVAALVFAGCGGGSKKTIPQSKAQSFLTQLDTISNQVDNKACTGARAKVQSLKAQVSQLPSSVDRKVKQNLLDGLDRLNQLVAQDCTKPPTPTPTVTQTVPTVTQTVPTQTQTVPTPTQTVPTTTTPPPTNTTPSGGGVTVPGTTTPSGGTGGTP
jgi:outer membrane murein-binding lipoprotein Lpp